MPNPVILRARDFRREAPRDEALLWEKLRGTHIGVRFRRQHPIGPFIADFASLRPKLVIEID